jgi:anaerobic magnesium-protoporphyrin IX monomethyl ester cyclase
MRILLIFIDIASYHEDGYHFGLASISSYLKEKGYEVSYKYIASTNEYQDLLKYIKTYSPKVIGISSVESQFLHVKHLSELIKSCSDAFIVCGGMYPTLFPETLKEAESLDGVIIGEGEIAFYQLLEKIKNKENYHDSLNFCYYDKQEGKVKKNALLPLAEDLDTLPFPDREIFDYKKYLIHRHSLQFLFNRGCPFSCTYCSNHAFAKVYGKNVNYTRFRSPLNCINEIKTVLKKYNTNKPIQIVDDLFTLNKKWLFGFLDMYKREIKRPFICCTRSNLANQEIFTRLKEAGCFRVMMSIESGNDFIRNEIMKRNISNEEIIESFRLARKYGMETSGVAMVGLPFETREMVFDTIKMIAKTKATDFTLNVFYPYKGTDLYNVCKENKFLPLATPENISERRESILELDTLTKDEIIYFQKNCKKLVMKLRPFNERFRFYIKEYVGILLRKIRLLDSLRNSKYYLKIRSLLHS